MNDNKYSGWLIVSDIDGTLNNSLRKTPKVNINAIEDFVHNKGGSFTLASARNVQSLTPHYINLPDLKTPAIVLNGAAIYDFSQKKILWFNQVSDNAAEIIKKSMDKFSSLEVGVFTTDKIYLVRPKICAPVMMALDSLKHKKVRTIDEVPKGDWCKIIFFCMPWLKEKIKEYAMSLSDESVTYIDTTVSSFDMVNATTNKGNAVLRLAEILGIDENNIGAIGDYYNDLDMLRTVKHPACCKHAPEELHKICEYVTCHCNDGAVADFINYIYRTY